MGFSFVTSTEPQLPHIGDLGPENMVVSEVVGLEKYLISLYRSPQHTFGTCAMEYHSEAKKRAGICQKGHRFGAEWR